MKKMPNMLMAGAAGRNLGKTEFLCRAIRAQSARGSVVGIKVTTIDDANAPYRDIAGDYLISREEPSEDNKDTHRMLRSGAESVYWLRVKRPALEQGLQTLFDAMVGDGIDLDTTCLVMESGGARACIQPGLFFVIQEHNDELKPAVAKVAHLVDRMNNISSDGWDVMPEDLVFENHQWGLKEDAAAIVLCGGASTRMGEDKAAMRMNEKPMLSVVTDQLAPHFASVLVSGNPDLHGFTAYPVIEDIEPNRGPLMGLLSALKASDHPLNFVTTCDAPEVHMPLIRSMLRWIEDYDAVVPIFSRADRKQPLFAVYRRSVIPDIERLLATGKQAMFGLLDELNVHYVEVDAEWYENLNTPEDVDRFTHGKRIV